MVHFNEVMDISMLIKKSRKLKNNDNAKLKIAILSSYSIQFFVFVIRYLLLEEGIEANIYEGEYDGIAMDILDDNSPLYSFHPDIVIILPHYTDIKEYPPLFCDKQIQQSYVDNQVCYYTSIWNKLSKLENCYILQANYVTPNVTQLGNIEASYSFSKSSYIKQLNNALVESRSSNVSFIDLDSLASNLGKNSWFDYSAYFMNKSGFNMDYLGVVAQTFVRQICALRGKVRKCLVLDLDNTLWGGTVGDLGYENIMLDPNNALGEAYLFFQQYVLDLKDRGVILAICSKNDLEVAKSPFLHNVNMRIKLEDISYFCANWDDKATNIKNIARELNIGLDSVVFFDDNPAEREIVQTYLPEVLVIDVPDSPEGYALALERESPFDWVQITREDLVRTQSYFINTQRRKMEASFVNYDEYLMSLEMQGKWELVDTNSVERFTQLINKSNQFNLRTRRYTESDIVKLSESQDNRCIAIKLKDKFSSYGIISCIILKKYGEVCFIDTWLMSCRVLKRGVEQFAFRAVLECARSLECTCIVGEYIPTRKNNMVKDFYEKLGFVAVNNNKVGEIQAEENGTLYQLEGLDSCKVKEIYIENGEV